MLRKKFLDVVHSGFVFQYGCRPLISFSFPRVTERTWSLLQERPSLLPRSFFCPGGAAAAPLYSPNSGRGVAFQHISQSSFGRWTVSAKVPFCDARVSAPHQSPSFGEACLYHCTPAPPSAEPPAPYDHMQLVYLHDSLQTLPTEAISFPSLSIPLARPIQTIRASLSRLPL